MSSKFGLLLGSITTVLPLVLNPLAWIGVVAGSLIGWGVCWLVFVLPFQKNLAEREVQLDHWSQLNQQLQEQTMDNRSLSQTELKQFIATNQEAAAGFAEIQQRLQQREIRMSETPISFVLIPITVLALAFGGVVAVFKAMNQDALATIKHVMQLAPHEMLQSVVARHLVISSPHTVASAALLPMGSGAANKSDVVS